MTADANDLNERAASAYEQSDFQLAAQLWQLSATAGSAAAQDNLGRMYEFGQGVGQDYAKALALFQAAAQQGVSQAWVDLGVMYALGRGVQKDDAHATDCYRKAAELGNQFGQHNLANQYKIGVGVAQDYDQALFWYQQAAKQGSLDALFGIGELYERMFDADDNLADAIAHKRLALDYYRQASDQGDAESAYRAAFVAGKTKAGGSMAEGMPWMMKAAQMGYAPAQQFLKENAAEIRQ